MSLQVEERVEGKPAVERHRLAYPAFPAEVAQASRDARRAMRWPMMVTAGHVLLALTATLAILTILRPQAAAGALLVSGILLLIRTIRPVASYDTAIGWVYRFGILAGIVGQLIADTVFRASASPVPAWPWLATDALGVGGAIGLGVALATSTAVVVLTFMYNTLTLRESRLQPNR